MNHLAEDYGVTAFIATLIIVGSFVLLLKGVDQSLQTLIGSWISAIISAIVVIKATKKPKE